MTNGITRIVLIKDNVMERTSTPEYGPNSPTDSSEDSVEVKVEAIQARTKRKLVDTTTDITTSTPLKKRICLRGVDEQPFRPWSNHDVVVPSVPPPVRHAYFRPPSPIRSESPPQPVDLATKSSSTSSSSCLRIPVHPAPTDSEQETDVALTSSLSAFPKLQQQQQQQQQRKEQRNYKNMTRERRIEANARERTRVHTISAAFDTLRRSVPAYSHSQKLSKLSVLRIACSYIMTLSNMLDDSPEVGKCVEAVSLTIQREGKIRKKKEEDE